MIMKKIPSGYHQLLKSKKKILIIGSNSSLAKEVEKLFKREEINLKKISKKKINFYKNYKSSKLNAILNKFEPDIILNFIGKFSLNKNASKELLIVNVLPTWELIKYYINKKLKSNVNLIVLGSSAYKSPRKKYMMYSASKLALNRLVKSAEELFVGTKFKIKIFNPGTFGGKHMNGFKKKQTDNIYSTARKIYKYINKLK